ncbi:endonuclease [Agrobacterium rubi]|uniref:DNA/RNA non-specific endonuclease n=1 Tax=Agrobacterium rubi TaxID=28099 RepID=UPI00201B746F|nr:DNA/RNA non-specific endonuclease [Agrobacterium rubi]MCL6654979.1 endonuclease [Agrobacterium rubi]
MVRKTTGRAKTSAAVTEDDLRRHIRAKGADYLKDPNITSVGIGLKNGNGAVCLQFTVGRKGESALESLSTTRIPEMIDVDGTAVPTDVIERSYGPSYKLVSPEQLDLRKQRIDPIRPGVSVAHIAQTAGTIGLIVFDRSTGSPCILSNWHVLNGNGGRIGDAIVQPGPYDDNNTALNGVGELMRSHIGAAGDCALARIRLRDFDRSVYGLDVIPKRMARVSIGDKVIKSGRTTAITRGIVRRVDVMAKINYGLPTGEQAIGGFEIGPDKDALPADGEISKGGDSGSAWLVFEGGKATDIFAGLHFAGETDGVADEHALACYPASIQKKLDFVLEPDIDSGSAHEGMVTVVPRTGYDAEFLGGSVPEPGLSTSLKRDAVNFGRAQTLPYTHFSVCLSTKRRMARYVAWNIDGARMVVLPRRGFALDPRIDAKYQLGDDFYVDNRIDRGHIARRADLCWGPVAEAEQANRDSFYFTNIAPQHERYNQSSRNGLWGELENLVLEQADIEKIKLSVQGGPIFGNDDIPYRDALIPRAFWKMIAYVGSDQQLRCAAFILSQDNLLNDLETLDLDPFRLYQVSLTELTMKTELDFAPLDAADLLLHPELISGPVQRESLMQSGTTMKEIRNTDDVIL